MVNLNFYVFKSSAGYNISLFGLEFVTSSVGRAIRLTAYSLLTSLPSRIWSKKHSLWKVNEHNSYL